MRFEIANAISIDSKNFIPTVGIDVFKDFKPYKIELVGDINKQIVIVKVNDKLYAISNVCPHQHRQSLHKGFVENGCIVCPEHGWTFNLETGENVNNSVGTQKLEKFEIIVIDRVVYIRIDHIQTKKWSFSFEQNK
jgi:nitrite reductase/ring-hydroxylating ferredoxin subunit